MTLLVIIVFILGFCAIMFEKALRLDKAATALLSGVLCWLIFFLQSPSTDLATNSLLQHFAQIASILFFLMGAMTIVELIDSHGGFEIISRMITAQRQSTLLLIISVVTFLLSALLDNLTTAIVMTSLTQKLIAEREERLWFMGIIIIAANAGGVWSPLGDVTTTMLWIGGQITVTNIIVYTMLPGISVAVIPTLIVARRLRNLRVIRREEAAPAPHEGGNIILVTGLGLLLFVPAFKTITHLPPFMGMLLALGLIWLLTSVLHRSKEDEERQKFSVASALGKIDTPSILFFLGILLSVSALQSFGLLNQLSLFLDNTFQNDYAIGIALGLLSSIIDNVPLVAAAQGMYAMTQFSADHHFWEFLALSTGTGGSIIIIGSAAGVAVMGMENISFSWYVRKISFLAFLGFTTGVTVFILQQWLMNV